MSSAIILNQCYAIRDANGRWIAGGTRTTREAFDVPPGGRSSTWTQIEPCPVGPPPNEACPPGTTRDYISNSCVSALVKGTPGASDVPAWKRWVVPVVVGGGILAALLFVVRKR